MHVAEWSTAVYAAGSTCSVSAWLYAGQASLLQELKIIPAAKTRTMMITALFMAFRFCSGLVVYVYRLYLVTKKSVSVQLRSTGYQEFYHLLSFIDGS